MDKFEEKEIMKMPFAKITWYDWLINYIPEPIKNSGQCYRQNCESF